MKGKAKNKNLDEKKTIKNVENPWKLFEIEKWSRQHATLLA